MNQIPSICNPEMRVLEAQGSSTYQLQYPGWSLYPQFAGFLIMIFLTTAGKTEPKCKHPFRPLIWGPALKVLVLLPTLDDPSQSSQWQLSSQHL